MDGIVPELLVKTSVSLSVPLSIIFNHSFNTAFVPDDWKKAYVSAKFKKRDKENPGNYRPISLTFQVCKVFESMLRDSIVDHLKENKLIHDSQHGFMKNRSCVTNLLQFLETVTDYIDKGYPVDVIYLDFQKAFDEVPHHRLMHRWQSLELDPRLGFRKGTKSNFIKQFFYMVTSKKRDITGLSFGPCSVFDKYK